MVLRHGEDPQRITIEGAVERRGKPPEDQGVHVNSQWKKDAGVKTASRGSGGTEDQVVCYKSAKWSNVYKKK